MFCRTSVSVALVPDAHGFTSVSRMIWKTLAFTLLLAGVLAQEFHIPEVNKEQIKDALRKRCKDAGAEDKVDDVANSAHAFMDCIKTLVNVEELKNEIEKAKPNGALDDVFKKYCAKTPQLKTCIHTLLDGVSPCLDAASRDQLSSAKNGTAQLIDFVCYKDGDRIALFISEHGPECFQEKSNALRECATNVKNSVSAESVNTMTMAQKCAKFDELSACVVAALEQCSTPTPGNMAESLFRYVRKGSPCNTALPKN